MVSKVVLCAVMCAILLVQNGSVQSLDVNSTYVDYMRSLGINPEEISTVCATYLGAIFQKDPYVLLRMFDASSKIPSGLGYGKLYDLGAYDECVEIETTTLLGELRGKHCMGNVAITTSEYAAEHLEVFTRFMSSVLPRQAKAQTVLPFQISVCIPHLCSAADFSGLVLLTEENCHYKGKEPDLDGWPIAAITILSIFGAIAAASTAYDVYLHYQKKKVPHELLTAFSFFTNGKKLIASTSNQEQLLCLNGIKALSNFWVIFFHEFFLMQFSPISNLGALSDWLLGVGNMFIIGATLSVDSFLVAGGVVTMYTFLKGVDRGAKFNLFKFYLHRYLRLTPVFAAVILIYSTLIPYFGTGPMYPAVIKSLAGPCEDYWWAGVLHIQNYVNAEDMCLSQSWYISVDFQIYLLLPLVLLPLIKWPKFGYCELGFLVLSGMAIPFGVAYGLGLSGIGGFDTNIWMHHYYVQTYGRFGPYIVGMIMGYIIYHTKKSGKKIRLNWLTALGAWAIILSGLLACILSGHQLVVDPYNKWAHSLFLAFYRTGWAVFVAALVYLCIFGYGGPVNYFLSLPIFQFLTKLSYSMYLIHFLVVSVRYGTMKTSFQFSNIELARTFWGDYMFSLVISVFLYLIFESPVPLLEKYLLGGGRRKTEKPKVAPEAEKKPKEVA